MSNTSSGAAQETASVDKTGREVVKHATSNEVANHTTSNEVVKDAPISTLDCPRYSKVWSQNILLQKSRHILWQGWYEKGLSSLYSSIHKPGTVGAAMILCKTI